MPSRIVSIEIDIGAEPSTKYLQALEKATRPEVRTELLKHHFVEARREEEKRLTPVSEDTTLEDAINRSLRNVEEILDSYPILKELIEL